MTLLVDETQRLHTRLCKWVALPHHHWRCYYCMSTGIVYKKAYNSWISYQLCISTTRSSTIYLLDTLHSIAPTGISLATVQPINDRLVIFEGIGYTDIDTIPP